jgi:hypothetical protein
LLLSQKIKFVRPVLTTRRSHVSESCYFRIRQAALTREQVKDPSPRHGPPWLALTRGREDRISTAQAKRDSQERETGARGRSHREINMRFSDEVIASYLNDEWRTSPDVHRLLNNRGNDYDIAYALERLARQGQIECMHKATMAPRYRDKSGPPVLCINYYRKIQRG